MLVLGKFVTVSMIDNKQKDTRYRFNISGPLAY